MHSLAPELGLALFLGGGGGAFTIREDGGLWLVAREVGLECELVDVVQGCGQGFDGGGGAEFEEGNIPRGG